MLGRLLRSVFGRPSVERPPAAVAANRRVYAIGDIHGRADLLDVMHRKIRDDASALPAAYDKVVVYLGDYVDRGYESREVIDMLLAPALPEFERVHLLGNHEAFMLDFYDNGHNGAVWVHNGGNTTLHSYGVTVKPNVRTDEELAEAALAFRDALPRAHVEFLRGLRLSHVEGDYAFVHAGVRPGVPLPQQDEADLIWIRRKFTESEEDFGRVIVHGHTITSDVDVRWNRIGVDTGAYASGVLSCLVLDGTSRLILQT
jgi:serine/threonine protein phosphatase 1